MNRFKRLVLVAAVAGVCISVTAPKAEGQVIVDIGAEPECPYGYYDYEPYACAPYARVHGFTALPIFAGM